MKPSKTPIDPIKKFEEKMKREDKIVGILTILAVILGIVVICVVLFTTCHQTTNQHKHESEIYGIPRRAPDRYFEPGRTCFSFVVLHRCPLLGDSQNHGQKPSND
jgi:hypothetical protein